MVRTVSVMGTVFLFLTGCILTSGTSALAEEKNFSLHQVLEFSLHNNGEQRALREEKGIREAGKIKAGLYPNPVFELEGTTGELSGSPSENRLSIGISQEFLTMGKREKRQQVAGKELAGFERQIDNSRRLLVEEIKTTFYDLLLAEKKLDLAERSTDLNTRLLEVTKQRFEAGDVPELEVNLARVEVARSEGRKADVERDLYPAKARLLTLMGLSADEKAGFAGTLEVKPYTKDLEELKKLAQARRPDLMALEAEKAKNEAEITLAQAEAIPNVTAGIGYQRENTAIEVGGVEGKSRDNLIGLKVSIPIPLFDRNQAGIQEARARKGSADNRYLFARLAIEREVEAAYARLVASEKSMTIYRENILPQLEENLKIIQEAYKLGEVGILTVIEEVKKFSEVNEAYLAALYNLQIALVKLDSATGTDIAIERQGGKQ